jgi:hypothetical protein
MDDDDDDDNAVVIVVVTITTGSTTQCGPWPSSKALSALPYLVSGSSNLSPLET